MNRRGFLKGLGLAALTAPIAVKAASEVGNRELVQDALASERKRLADEMPDPEPGPVKELNLANHGGDYWTRVDTPHGTTLIAPHFMAHSAFSGSYHIIPGSFS